ncbi:hypothetical protein MGYG_02921 [Nannizzia gypsea CBS 118893]|uniref:Uncharacterized protein n=1 Tax=Arthroderma gypseum (strain ATCC MYA-4604 / CBS 118893) TaxID=535722 RepID=E4UPU1_ARTGP|nr:hypothetical protein MGYG_02921 [Nannizzia gypsea CBS 118893]EFQ99913.1 hypothetical protein MGYG_02921 [Nannizzia gypsea CBS 118893]
MSTGLRGIGRMRDGPVFEKQIDLVCVNFIVDIHVHPRIKVSVPSVAGLTTYVAAGPKGRYSVKNAPLCANEFVDNIEPNARLPGMVITYMTNDRIYLGIGYSAT